MEAFNCVTGIAAPMMAANIDTDVIMPKQFLKGIDRSGLDKGLFFDLRFNQDGSLNEDFILNQPGWLGASFLVVGPNFGCGSSREHAVWGLKQLGIKALIGTSFAGIFNDNCLRNGVLTICLSETEIQQIANAITQRETNTLQVDLAQQTITSADNQYAFTVDQIKKDMLLQGLDAIGFTLSFTREIKQFEEQYFARNPWHRTVQY
ncbi:3-isopropylmalate dehydratase small subunit [Atlantibacter subterraneus]|jgi:3-isopropylmalate/(R)-2-methylmalate dehydratase small subunit|uniref:3-isopropylmalate dehydratase small subunit n=1 Tax=Atlantibacter subterraneus TaxID=255519 RepID=A0A3R9GE74_9ENTR|nr:3-isopropylmalate dehydratase small subunit [Atlantibacter subterranea]MDZ5664645.1 3-isopropylmalate dehydratase small subunit [Atlantibacter hermannii]MDA3131511.1 3-isopropylmalate dehydratase small subunit [Atlantibacter subterranea]MDV7021257.1 3-isopropylmalate dehydratase small subunit [Atlantibacter subterranea]RSB59324.1 3-isopropylmalate dehydratase small subunit [Atlantibacter subterranea]RSE01522.1 3-isopropylmalate dehydratase small subunit [Atlantibacter subterranea]